MAGEFAFSEERMKALLRSARAGEEAAQEELFHHCEPIVSSYVARNAFPSTLRWMQREELVAWIIEEVLCSLEHLPEGPACEALLIRLRRVSFERTRDCHRNQQQLLGASASPAGLDDPAISQASVGPVTVADEKRLLERLIQALPESYARVVDLHLREGLDFQEIGERIGMTRDGAYRQYKRARDLLIERARPQGDE
jgi:DNA-directed RNA polymerase specialized sigma24 family protein